MTCKHNWVEVKSNGTYPYVPETKQYNFKCQRCEQTIAALIKQEKANGR